MKDDYNNPAPVYNDLGTENSFNIMDHRNVQQILILKAIVDIKLVN